MSKVTFANSINIKEIYKDYYSGKMNKGNVCCPFHDDNNASMTLYTKNNKFKCFGCGFYGGPIDFVLNIKYNSDKSKFLDVVNELCNNYGYQPDPSEENGLTHNSVIKDVEAYQKKIKYTNDIKKVSYESHRCLPKKDNYFTQRGIPVDVQEQYSLGFMDAKLEVRDGVEYDNIIKAGILNTNKEINYKNRWIIPIKDIYGNYIAWAGRTLEPDQPKYINSPDSEYFHKNKVLWNYDIAKKYNDVYVVEGFMDALSLITAGIPNVVALMGCNMSNEQYQLLKDKNVILALDNDIAGDRAMCKIILNYREQIFSVLDLKDKKVKDLNELLVKKGKAEVSKVIQNNLKSGVEWCLLQTAFYTDLRDEINQEKLWKTLSKLIGAREEAYQNAYPLNLKYSPIMFNKYWKLFDQIITKKNKK